MLRVLGVPFWTLRLRVWVDCWRGDLSAYPYVQAAAAATIIRSVRAMTLLMGGGSLISMWLFGWATPLLYWIGPQLLGSRRCGPICWRSTPAAHRTATG